VSDASVAFVLSWPLVLVGTQCSRIMRPEYFDTVSVVESGNNLLSKWLGARDAVGPSHWNCSFSSSTVLKEKKTWCSPHTLCNERVGHQATWRRNLEHEMIQPKDVFYKDPSANDAVPEDEPEMSADIGVQDSC
jgi:hypothetical protein